MNSHVPICKHCDHELARHDERLRRCWVTDCRCLGFEPKPTAFNIAAVHPHKSRRNCPACDALLTVEGPTIQFHRGPVTVSGASVLDIAQHSDPFAPVLSIRCHVCGFVWLQETAEVIVSEREMKL